MGFNDVDTANYYCYALIYMADSSRGYIHGASAGDCSADHVPFPCYLPYNPVKRSEFSQILVSTYIGEHVPGWTLDTTDTPYFHDVNPGDQFYYQIQTLRQHNIVSGYPSSTCVAHGTSAPCFLPNNYIRHDEASIFLVRAATYVPIYPALSDFADVATSDFEYGALEALYYNSMIYPEPGTNKFYPSDNLNRADTAYYVYRTIYPRSISGFLGQIVTRKQSTGPYQGVDEYRTVPYGNDKGNWAVGPVAISNYSDTFMESGPSSNYIIYNDPIYGTTGDSGLHPYTSFAVAGTVYSFSDTSQSLAINAPYRYYSDYNGTGGRWSSFFCYSGTCKVEANAEYLGPDSLPYADALGETTGQTVHFGSSVVSSAMYTPYGQYSEYPWCSNQAACYEVVLSNLGQITNVSVTGNGHTIDSWTIQWPVGTQPGP